MARQATRYIDQNLLDTLIPRLEVSSISETELDDEKLSYLFARPSTDITSVSESIVPVPVGLAGAYTSKGTLTVLGVAVKNRILLIQFRSKDKPTIPAGRQLLQTGILSAANAQPCAFDLAPLAMSLYANHNLFLENAVDIQSTCQCPDSRIPANAVEFVLSGTKASGIHRPNIDTIFAISQWDPAKPETFRAVVLKAWLAGYLPLVGDMEERCRDVVKINTKATPIAVSVRFVAFVKDTWES